MKKDILQNIPSTKTLEGRFSFLGDNILRSNVVIAFRYSIFLTVLQEKAKFRGVLAYSIYKDIILYAAAIIESCLHYTVKQLLDKGVVKSNVILPNKWVDVQAKDIYKISDSQKVCGVIKESRSEEFKPNTDFIKINRAAKNSGLLSRGLFARAETLRKKRNRIHLAGLGKTDDYYGKQDIRSAFTTANLILKVIESKLKEIQTSQSTTVSH